MQKTTLMISAAAIALGLGAAHAETDANTQAGMKAAGNHMEAAADATGNAVESAAESTGNAMENAAEATSDAMDPDVDQAELIDPATASAEELAEADVVMADGEEIGSVVAVITDDASQPEAVIISVGGFLGVGDKYVEMEVSELSQAKEEDAVAISATKEELEAMPAYEGKAVENLL